VPGEKPGDYRPGFLGPDSVLGYYESGEDTLLLFYLFLLAQLNARDLFPPDLHRYTTTLSSPRLNLYNPSAPPARRRRVPPARRTRPPRPPSAPKPASGNE